MTNHRAAVRAVFPRAVCAHEDYFDDTYAVHTSSNCEVRLGLWCKTKAEAWQRAAETLRQDMRR